MKNGEKSVDKSTIANGHLKKHPNLSLNAVNHYFGTTQILHDIDLSLYSGEVITCIGPSGGGKSTLLRLCAGLIEVNDGVYHNSFNDMAFVFQDDRLLPWQTTLNNIAFGLKSRGLDKRRRQQRARQLGLEVGLDDDDMDKYPADLSGGMRQRVSFARAFALRAPLMLLDEPFSALDIGLKQLMQQKLIYEVEEHHLAVLIVTHDLMEAVQLAHQIIVLSDKGKVLSQLQLKTPLSQRDNEFVYLTTAELLENPVIQTAFNIES